MEILKHPKNTLFMKTVVLNQNGILIYLIKVLWLLMFHMYPNDGLELVIDPITNKYS